MVAQYQSPQEPVVVGGVIRADAELYPSRTCITFGDESVTYRQLHEDVNRLARGLQRLPIHKGEKVAVLVPNIPEFFVAYFACATIGAVLVPIHVQSRGPEIRYFLENSDAVAIILAGDCLEAFESMPARPPMLREIVFLDRPAGSPNKPRDPHQRFRDLLAANPPTNPDSEVRTDDPFGIFYTSGTTSLPKGAVLSHRQAIAGADAWADGLGLTPATQSLCVAPYSHIAFNAFVFATFRMGGGTVVMESFQLRRLLREIERTRTTFIFATPSVFITMVHDPQLIEFDLSSLETILFGAAPTPVEIIHQMREKVGAALYHGYGQTETSGALSRLLPEFAVAKTGSVGKPLRGIEIAILDDEDCPVPAGEPGEICCHCPNALTEYYKMPEATAQKLRSGWLHTGDQGYFDQDGFLYVIGRKDDVIICYGEKVSPGEVEEVLYTHPDVFDAAVVGLPDRVRGEAVVAFIVPRPGARISASEVRRYCRERLAAYKVPRAVEMIESIPRNPAGKVVRSALRQMKTPPVPAASQSSGP